MTFCIHSGRNAALWCECWAARHWGQCARLDDTVLVLYCLLVIFTDYLIWFLIGFFIQKQWQKNRSRSRKHSFATWLQNAFSGSYDVLWLSPLRAWQVWRCKSCGHGFGRAHEVVHSMLKKLSACFVDDTKPYQITSNQNLRRLLQEGHLADLSSESCQWQNDLQIYSTAIMPRIFPCLMHPKSTGCCESEVDCTDIVLTLYWL